MNGNIRKVGSVYLFLSDTLSYFSPLMSMNLLLHAHLLTPRSCCLRAPPFSVIALKIYLLVGVSTVYYTTSILHSALPSCVFVCVCVCVFRSNDDTILESFACLDLLIVGVLFLPCLLFAVWLADELTGRQDYMSRLGREKTRNETQRKDDYGTIYPTKSTSGWESSEFGARYDAMDEAAPFQLLMLDWRSLNLGNVEQSTQKPTLGQAD